MVVVMHLHDQDLACGKGDSGVGRILGRRTSGYPATNRRGGLDSGAAKAGPADFRSLGIRRLGQRCICGIEQDVMDALLGTRNDLIANNHAVRRTTSVGFPGIEAADREQSPSSRLRPIASQRTDGLGDE